MIEIGSIVKVTSHSTRGGEVGIVVRAMTDYVGDGDFQVYEIDFPNWFGGHNGSVGNNSPIKSRYNIRENKLEVLGMANYSELSVGTEVRDVKRGYVGIIKIIRDSHMIGVEFSAGEMDKMDDSFALFSLHNLDGALDASKGYYYLPSDIEVMTLQVGAEVFYKGAITELRGQKATIVQLNNNAEYPYTLQFENPSTTLMQIDGYSNAVKVKRESVTLLEEGVEPMVDRRELKVGRIAIHKDGTKGQILGCSGSLSVEVRIEDGGRKIWRIASLSGVEKYKFEDTEVTVGMTVVHNKYGKGMIVHLRGSQDREDMIGVAFERRNERLHSLSGYAPDGNGYWCSKWDFTDVDTRIDYNKIMQRYIQSESLSDLKGKLNEQQGRVERIRRDLTNALKRMKDFEKAVIGFKDNIVDFNKMKDAIESMEKVNKCWFDPQEGYMLIETNTLYITASNGGKYVGGRYKIQYRIANSDVKFFNLDDENKRRSYWGSGCHHPHVSNSGNPCLGNTSESIALLASENHFDVLAQMLIAFLEQANLDDIAGKHVMNWDKVLADGTIQEGYKDEDADQFEYGDTPDEDCMRRERQWCSHCDEYVDCDEDDMVYIEGLGNVCPDCLEQDFTRCADCDEWVRDDQATTIHDGDTVCDTCLENRYTFCDECNNYFPSDEMNEHNGRDLCDGCFEHVTENEASQVEETQEEVAPAEALPVATSVCSRCGSTNTDYCDEQGNLLCETCYRTQFPF